jgi:DNA repair protein SbcD/Mre11
MKFIHTADWHLGKVVYQRSMIDDQRFILDKLLEFMKTEEIKVLVIAGDIYDRSIPPAEAVNCLNEFLDKAINEYKMTVMIISGNHDSSDRLEFASGIMGKQGLHIVGNLEKEMKKIVLEDEHGPVNFYLLPFFKPSVIKYDMEVSEIQGFDDAMQYYLSIQDIDINQRNVLITHQFVSGSSDMIQSESEMPLSVGGTSQIGVEHFEMFDYVALGHLHAPQSIGRPTCRYSGSLLKYSVDEAKQHKAIAIVDMDVKGKTEVTTHPLEVLRDLRVIRGLFKDILTYPSSNTQDYIAVVLEDDGMIVDAMDQIRQIYPNCLTVSYHRNEPDNVSFDLSGQAVVKATDHMAIFKEFYMANFGEEPVEPLVTIMTEIIEKARERYNETD